MDLSVLSILINPLINPLIYSLVSLFAWTMTGVVVTLVGFS
jgi:hypothetical protein